MLGAFINFVILAPIIIQHGEIAARVLPSGAVVAISRAEIVNHEHLGVPPRQFAAFFVALRDVFAEVLGADWTPDIDTAWAELLVRIDGLLLKSPA